ncbi:hypothetical protein RIF29_27490 [Crotalaria pallida]|uniref:Transcription repressor n=1 Tax=Crotalaria pallida TaxID=3830 RepID=A0AAN9ERC7_CROPI
MRRVMRNLLTRNGGCGCGKLKPSEVYVPKQKPKISIYQNTNPSSHASSTTTSGGDHDHDHNHFEDFTPTTTTISEEEADDISHHDHKNSTKNHSSIPKPCTKLVGSIAVEKDSDDPYNDFRHSMLHMIFEKEIYSENDLQELLQCFLQLNAPCHHDFIVHAFIEICEETFPKKFDGGGGGPETSRRNNIINGKSR